MKRKIAIALSAVLMGGYAAGGISGDTISAEKTNLVTLVENSLTPAVAAAKKEKKAPKRFIYLFSDDGFNYYLDKMASCRTTPPAGFDELVEVWVKLLPLGLAPETEVADGQTYYLQHYMLWPEKEKIMFLSELEIDGRPDNNIKERPFDGHNWERLIPGSLEDNIYRNCIKYQSKLRKAGKKKGTSATINDFLENTLRISL